MLLSDVYRNSVEQISNDLIIGMIAGTETSRNTTIYTLCHLIKNTASRERVFAEINASMARSGLDDVLKMGHKHTKETDFEFLNMVVSESLRYNAPAPTTEEFRIAKDCQLGKYRFKKDQPVIFFIH